MTVEICQEAFDPWIKLADYQSQILGHQGKFGATATFVGTMRDFNEGDDVQSMFLEHYSGMTEKQIENIVAEAAKKWDFLDSYIVHRVGDIYPNDPIVLVVVWSEHRADAFECSRFLMEKLKSEAPFWKKEVLREGERWVAKNTLGFKKDLP